MNIHPKTNAADAAETVNAFADAVERARAAIASLEGLSHGGISIAIVGHVAKVDVAPVHAPMQFENAIVHKGEAVLPASATPIGAAAHDSLGDAIGNAVAVAGGATDPEILETMRKHIVNLCTLQFQQLMIAGDTLPTRSNLAADVAKTMLRVEKILAAWDMHGVPSVAARNGN